MHTHTQNMCMHTHTHTHTHACRHTQAYIARDCHIVHLRSVTDRKAVIMHAYAHSPAFLC